MTKEEKLKIEYAVRPNLKEHKEIDMSGRTVDLVANTYWWFDVYADVLVPGCCVKSIQDRGPKSDKPGKIKHANNHQLKEAYALPTLLEETTIDNLFVLHANSYFPETQLAEDKLTEYNVGLIDQHSIGFNYKQLEYVEEGSDVWDDTLKKLINPEDAQKQGYLYLVKEIELFEYSNVAFGANRLTDTIGIKSDNPNIHYNNLIAKLDALHVAMRSGGDKFNMMVEEKQIKQMIYELYNPEPSLKDTGRPSEGDTFDLSSAIDSINFKIN